MLAQVAFPILLHLVGCLLSTCYKRTTDMAFAWLSGIFWGLALWVTWAVIVLSLGLPFTAGVMFGGIALLAILMLWLHVRRKSFDRSDLLWFVLSTAIIAIAATLAARYNHTAASFDSFTQILIGKELAHHRGFDPDVHAALASWGVFTPAVQAAAVLINVDYLSALWPTMGVAFLCCFVPLCMKVAIAAGAPTWFAVLSAEIGAAFLATTYFFTFQCFYIHNNLPSAIYLLFAVATMWLALHTGRRSWLIFSTASFFTFILLRTEAPLFVVVFMAPVWCATDLDRRTRLKCMLPLTIATLAWYAKLLTLIGGGTDILSPTKAIALMGLMAVATLVAALPDRPWRRRLAMSAPWTMMIAGTVVIVMTIWRQPRMMQESLEAIAENLFFHGGWGWTWAFVVALLGLSIALPRISRQEVWTVGLGLFWMLVFALAVFRENPYRTGWGDSANRLMTQSLPIAVMYLITRFGAALRTATIEFPALRRSMTRGVCAILVVVLAAGAIMPINVARRITVLESSPMHDGHDFLVAFLKEDHGEYVASINPGLATVLLDMGRRVSADRLEITEYDPSQAWTDFAWQVSDNGEDWRHVYDTRTSHAESRLRIDESTSRFRLTGQGKFRYLKLTFRESKGQNRLLLRRLCIYSMPIYTFNRLRADWKKYIN
jgi:hypothetical protein